MSVRIEFLNILVVLIFILQLIVLLLMCMVFLIRSFSDYFIKKRKKFCEKYEYHIFEYLEGDYPASELINSLKRRQYKYLFPILRQYLLELKGSDYEKLADLINKSELFDYLVKRLKSFRGKFNVEAAYYLGLACSKNAKRVLLEKLNSGNDLVFYNCALSLAKLNEPDVVVQVVSKLEKHQMISKDSMITILLEFGAPVCLPLNRILNDKTPDRLKSVIITILGHLKFYDSAPKILHYLIFSDKNNLKIDCINALGSLEYLDAVPALKRLLNHPKPEIRFETIKAISKIGDPALESKLIEKIYDDNWYVQYEAAKALLSFSGESKMKLFEISKAKNKRASVIAEMVLEENYMRDALEYS